MNAENKLYNTRQNSQSGRLRRQFSMEASPTLSQLKHKYASFDHNLKPPLEMDELEMDNNIPTSNSPSVYQTPYTSPLIGRREPEYNAEIFSIQMLKRGNKRRSRSTSCKLVSVYDVLCML